MAPPLEPAAVDYGGIAIAGSPSPPKVIVIGAGVAGLAAARVLRNANARVLVLESRQRIGGRVHTDWSLGFPVDMGASWLHGASDENPLAPLIAELESELYLTGGDHAELFEHDLHSFALFDADGTQIPRELVAKLGEVFAALVQDTKKLVTDEADMSVSDALRLVLERRHDLRQDGVAARVLQWYLCRMEGWFATDADRISVRTWDAQGELLRGGHGFMTTTFGPVISSLAQDLDIRLNHKVTAIESTPSGVRVTTANNSNFTADACIVTLPLGVLKSNTLTFSPPLPTWKSTAITDIGMGIQNKVALLFSTPFWPDVEFLGVISATSYDSTYFLNLHKSTGRPVLVYMPAGRRARDIETMSDASIVQFAMQKLRSIVKSPTDPVKWAVSRWGRDEHSMGCYSYDAVGKSHDVYERLRKDVGGVVFWAGEATSERFPGTVHGAYDTGVMAAKECMQRAAERAATKGSCKFATERDMIGKDDGGHIDDRGRDRGVASALRIARK